MNEIINNQLAQVEKTHDCQILFAVESGSRAWGFASPDSDYDVRFVYAHPLDFYLSVLERRDVIEETLPGDLDVSGWELRKALRLFAGCNLAFNEWLNSPIIYQSTPVLNQLRALIPDYFNPKKALHHYSSMAGRTEEAELSQGSIKIKKLFYILRPLFACRWIQDSKGMPPTVFAHMLGRGLAPAPIESIIRDLLEQKEVAVEGELIDVPERLLFWINEQLQALKQPSAMDVPPSGKAAISALDSILRDTILTYKDR